MSTKSKPAAAKKSATSKPSAAKATADADTKAKRKYTRAPILTRAVKAAGQVAKKVASLRRMLEGAVGENETPDQTDAMNLAVDTIKEIAPRAADIANALDVLVKSNWTPKAGSARRSSAIDAGDTVAIKEKHYDPEAHGEVNFFVVESVTEKYLRIRAVDGDAQFPIERSRVKLATSAAPAPAPAPAPSIEDVD